MSLDDSSATTLAPRPPVPPDESTRSTGSAVVESPRDEVERPVSAAQATAKSVPTDGSREVVEVDDEALGLTRGDLRLLLVVAVACLVALTVQWVRVSGWGTQPVEVVRQRPLFAEFRLDANTATWVEWMQIESIGEVLARRIVEDRETRGPFTSIEDLQRVSGIGPKTLEKLRPYVEVRDAVEPHP